MFYLGIIDFLKAEVSESKEEVRSPQDEVSDWVAIHVNIQVIYTADWWQGIQLNQTRYVRRVEKQSLRE